MSFFPDDFVVTEARKYFRKNVFPAPPSKKNNASVTIVERVHNVGEFL